MRLTEARDRDHDSSMDATAIQPAAGLEPRADVAARLPQWIADFAAACLLLLALLLLTRRLVGALQHPLDAPTLLATGLVVAGISLLLRWPCLRLRLGSNRR